MPAAARGGAMRDPDYPKGRADLIALAKRLRRPLATVYALSSNASPLMVGQDYRLARAHWFAELYEGLGIATQFHVRRIFYMLISQETPILQYNGAPFENTADCFNTLCDAVRDARYLGLIPTDAVIDRRNPPPTINFSEESSDTAAEVWTTEGEVERTEFGMDYSPPTYNLPELQFSEPTFGQRYHLEIWIEKSTANDVLLPLGRQYGINIATFVGEVSATACKNLVDRAIASGRPVRILHVTDFDPAGRLTMSVAAAVKIDFFAKQADPSLDIRLEQVALTEEQCVRYQLPRTPIKEKETRAANFEAQFGTGATELDALEALYPGALRQILVDHIQRYYDNDLSSNVTEAIDAFSDELTDAETEVRNRHSAEIAALDNQRNEITRIFALANGPAISAYDIAMQRARDAYGQAMRPARQRIEQMERDFTAQAEALISTLSDEMLDAAPNPGLFDWPDPAEGEEDGDALYISTRDYVDQVDRFREHQRKDDDVRLAEDRTVTKTCVECSTPFTSANRRKRYCGSNCANKAFKRSVRARREGLRQAKQDDSGQV
jgi:hypothetical protein